MRPCILLLFISAFALHSCGDSSTSMIGQIPVTTMVNPNVGVLIEDHLTTAALTDEQTIFGVASNRIFETKDNFKSFEVSKPIQGLTSEIVYVNSDVVITYEAYYKNFQKPITLYRYSRKGSIIEPSVILSWINDPLSAYDIEKVLLMNRDEGFLLVHNWYYYVPHRALIFKLDFNRKNATLLGEIKDFKPIEMKFADATNGFILLQSPGGDMRNTYISRTTDGGKTWSTPTAIDSNTPFEELEVIDLNHLIVFQSRIAYYSDDAGITWKLIKIAPGFINDITFANSTTGYCHDLSGYVSKSVDSGATWEVLGVIDSRGTQGAGLRLHFYNESVGIAFNGNQLYRTDDGGQSWKMLIYPFDYVTGD